MTARATVFLLVLSLTGTAGAAEFRVGQPVMGTILEVTVVAADVDQARRAAISAIAEVRRWEDVLTTWRSAGELAQLNHAAGQGPVPVSAALHRALARMVALVDETDGAFDPSVGPLVALWRATATPGSDALRAVQSVGIREALSLAPTSAALAHGAALDPGAIGKGIGLDAAIEVLRAAGIERAFLDFGTSSQIALGAPADSPQGWPVAIAGLRDGHVYGVVNLRDASLSTSRTRDSGAPDGTIIDPRTRRPVASARLATVRAKSAADADAWSTALVVLGRDGVARARHAGVDVFIQDAGGVVENPEFIDASGLTPSLLDNEYQNRYASLTGANR